MKIPENGADGLALFGHLIAAALKAAGFDLEERGAGPRLLAVKEAASYLGVGVTKFRQLETENIIPLRLDVAGMPRWDRRDLDKKVERIKRSNNGRKG